MKGKDLKKLGVPNGEPMRLVHLLMKSLSEQGKSRDETALTIRSILTKPSAYRDHEVYGAFARAVSPRTYVPRDRPAPYRQWGTDLDEQSVRQMERACQLPVSVSGALMPDAHVGYGLPIGGVLATDHAVIPYAVGVDIACRMKMTVLDLPPTELDTERGKERLTRAIETETRFGVGATHKDRRSHPVMDEDWTVSSVTRHNKDRAWSQLGTSGSGNHFVEFGVLTLPVRFEGLEPGTYLALLSHSGSRGTGASVADHYSRLAMSLHRELPKELLYLAWLDLDTEAGQEYWAAMELMGRYAAANHACIHRHIEKHLKTDVLLDIENHHNFAWKERHAGRNVIVHRKGATPAGEGVVGIIPGSMASPAFIVRGKGQPVSLHSASHGAGRVMSRKKALETFGWKDTNRVLKERGVTLISAGLDEVPFVYKNIEEVMAAQTDLVDIMARFDPRLVKMAPHGERPED
ncbi:MAG: RtcB family protein [candidate division Zixibacteria bacterium]|nr:RtcB family protein [candidate division Zixibacteria bacterium]